MPTLNILALDPSLRSTGLCSSNQVTCTLESNLLGTARLAHLRDQLLRALDSFRPDAVVLEDYAFGKGQGAHQIGEWGGVLRLMLHDKRIPVAFVAPTALKLYVTGKGNASKDLVLSELASKTGVAFATNDEADAWALGAMAYDFVGQPWLKVPVKNRGALVKVAWPECLRGLG